MSENHFTIKRKVPANFSEADRHLYDSDLVKNIPSPRVARFADITISSEGILFQNKRIMGESFARRENFERWTRRFVLKTYLQNLLIRPNRIVESAVWATDDWSNGYFHWISDVLPKVVIAKEQLIGSVLLLPAHLQKVDYVHSSLKQFGLHNVEFIRENETITVRQLYLPIHTAESGDFNEDVIGEVRQTLLAGIRGESRSPRRIYISRRKATRRKIVNEDEILDILRDHDFQIVCTEDLAFEEQEELFSSATHLISIHGAGLSNMLFMPEGSSVMELRKNDPGGTNCFFNMASALGHKFYYQLCEASEPSRAPHGADLIVDRDLFSRAVKDFLS